MAKPGILKQHQKGPLEEFCPDCILHDAKKQGQVYVVTEEAMALRVAQVDCPTCAGKGKTLTKAGESVKAWLEALEASL